MMVSRRKARGTKTSAKADTKAAAATEADDMDANVVVTNTMWTRCGSGCDHDRGGDPGQKVNAPESRHRARASW